MVFVQLMVPLLQPPQELVRTDLRCRGPREFHSQDDYRRDDRRDDRYDDRRPPGCNGMGSSREWKLQQPRDLVLCVVAYVLFLSHNWSLEGTKMTCCEW